METFAVYRNTRQHDKRGQRSPLETEERSECSDQSSGRDNQPGLTRPSAGSGLPTSTAIERIPGIFGGGPDYTVHMVHGMGDSMEAVGGGQAKPAVSDSGAQRRGTFNGDKRADTQSKHVDEAVHVIQQPRSNTLSGRAEAAGNMELGRRIIHPDHTLLIGDRWDDGHTTNIGYSDQPKPPATRPRPISRSGRGHDQVSEVSVESSTRYRLATPTPIKSRHDEVSKLRIHSQNNSNSKSNSRWGWDEASVVEDIEPDDSVSMVTVRGKTHSLATTSVSRVDMLEDRVVRLADTMEQVVTMVARY